MTDDWTPHPMAMQQLAGGTTTKSAIDEMARVWVDTPAQQTAFKADCWALVRRTEGEVRELQALRGNLAEAWAALRMIREAIETLGPVGSLQAMEHASSPTLMYEAAILVQGIRAIARGKT